MTPLHWVNFGTKVLEIQITIKNHTFAEIDSEQEAMENEMIL